MATFYNQATLSYSGGVVNSNITSGELVEVLSVTKTAVVQEYTLNSDITYAVNIVNSGAVSFTGITLSDNLGAYTFGESTLQPLDYVDGSVKYFLNGVLQAAPAASTADGLEISGISLPAGGTATVLYTVTANSYAPPAAAAAVQNTVTVSGNGITPITATESVTAAAQPLLSISKSLTPATVTEAGQLTYTFLIQNMGNTEASADASIVVTDTFNPILSSVTAVYNGTQWADPTNYTYNQATGLFQSVAGAITVPAATYTQGSNGEWQVTPGTSTLTVTGTV